MNKRALITILCILAIVGSIGSIVWTSLRPSAGFEPDHLDAVIGQRLAEAFARDLESGTTVRVFAMTADGPVTSALISTLTKAGFSIDGPHDLTEAGVGANASGQSSRDWHRALSAYYSEQLAGATAAVILGPLPERFDPGAIDAKLRLAVRCTIDGHLAKLISAGTIRAAVADRPGIHIIDPALSPEALFDQMYVIVTPTDMDILKH